MVSEKFSKKLSKEVFKKGLEDIQTSFDGFNLTEAKVKLWYNMLHKKIDDDTWKEKIFYCLVYCHRVPNLADILDEDNYYRREKK